ncbi:11534_t:CDS:1, partial [Racocetra fulgida]
HNYELYLDAKKFNINMSKLNQNELRIIKELHDNGIQTKNIYAVWPLQVQ